MLFTGLLAGFFWFTLDFSDKQVLIASQSNDLAETNANLDVIREEIGELVSSADVFQNTLDETLNILGIDTDTAQSSSGRGDLATLFNIEKSGGSSVRRSE